MNSSAQTLFQDRNQSFWQLAVITGSALGLPASAIGGEIAGKYGAGTALISIITGNFILWIIGLTVISMTKTREHAIENVKSYLGKKTSIIAALIWIFAFLIWYAIQIKGVATIVQISFNTVSIGPFGSILGIVVAFISMGGIHWIKKICTVALPLLIVYVISMVFYTGIPANFSAPWKFSIFPILSIVVVWLPGVVSLPTFFRHSRSRADSILGLSLMTLLHIFFQSFTVLVGLHSMEEIVNLFPASLFGGFLVVSFAVIFNLCSNLLNIYYASAGWEIIFPKHRSLLEYLIVGVLGSSIFIGLQLKQNLLYILYRSELLESVLAGFIASLGAVLIIAFLIRSIVQHRFRPFEKILSCFSWGVGCATVLISEVYDFTDSVSSIINGMIASAVFLLVVIFCEEMIWAIKNIKEKQFRA